MESGYRDAVRELILSSAACDLITKRFRPFRNPKLPEVMPSRPFARHRVLPQLHQFLSRVEPGLPGLTGHDQDSFGPNVGWMKRHDVDIGWDAIEVGHVVGMRGVRFEADVVSGEVSLELKIVIDDLLENVFLHRWRARFGAARGGSASKDRLHARKASWP